MARGSRKDDEKWMTFGEHLEELRVRLIRMLAGLLVAFVACFLVRTTLFRILWRPMDQVMHAFQAQAGEAGALTTRPIFTSPATAFLTLLKTSFVAAFVVASPWILYQMWAFVSAGLHANERRYVYILAPFSLISFLAGVLFCYFILMPFGLRFLVGQGLAMGADALLAVNEYFSFSLALMLVFGLAFQLPLVMMFLVKSGLVSIGTFRRRRRYAILALVIASAILTPPDVVTQVLLAGPLIGLYELGILMARMRLGKKETGTAAEDEP